MLPKLKTLNIHHCAHGYFFDENSIEQNSILIKYLSQIELVS